MNSDHVLPLQSQIHLRLYHTYNFKFAEVVRAFIMKYNSENQFCTTTIAKTQQIDQDSFLIVRRMENIMSSKPVYERIIFNRRTRQVHGFTFEKETDPGYVEHYCYKEN